MKAVEATPAAAAQPAVDRIADRLRPISSRWPGRRSRPGSIRTSTLRPVRRAGGIDEALLHLEQASSSAATWRIDDLMATGEVCSVVAEIAGDHIAVARPPGAARNRRMQRRQRSPPGRRTGAEGVDVLREHAEAKAEGVRIEGRTAHRDRPAGRQAASMTSPRHEKGDASPRRPPAAPSLQLRRAGTALLLQQWSAVPVGSTLPGGRGAGPTGLASAG